MLLVVVSAGRVGGVASLQHSDTLSLIEEDLISLPFLSDIPFTDPKCKKNVLNVHHVIYIL